MAFWEIPEEKEIRSLKKNIETLKENQAVKVREYERFITNLKEDQRVVLARKDAELDVRVAQSTKTLTDKIAKLELENGNYKKEVEILTKAFENLGFDVKDMKSILDKLVDGIVSKNSIQLIGTGKRD